MRAGSWASILGIYLFGVCGAATVSKIIPLAADIVPRFGLSDPHQLRTDRVRGFESCSRHQLPGAWLHQTAQQALPIMLPDESTKSPG